MFHPGDAYLLATFPILADFTPGAPADEEGYGANGHQYHQGESHQETKLQTMYHFSLPKTCNQLRIPSLCIWDGWGLAQAFDAD